MTVFSQLLPASFKNVPFLVPDETTVSGKKTVNHEYPNSNQRFVEELGISTPIYEITAIVNGNSAIQRRITLENTLREEGRGLLIHPVYGQVQVTATSFTSKSSDTSVGEFVFSITFMETQANISLNAGATSVQLVSRIADEARAALDASFLGRYINTNNPQSLQNIAGQFQNVINQVSVLGDVLPNPSSINLSDLNSVLSTAENIANTVVRDGGSFIGQIRGIYNSYESVSRVIGNYYEGYINLTRSNIDRVPRPQTTAIRIEEENNLSALDDQTRVNALISSYEAAAYIEYETDEELNENRQALESAYAELTETENENSLIFNPDVVQTINNLRVATRQVLEAQLQNTWRVVDIEPGESSMALTAYRYYGNIDNVDALAELNPSINRSISRSGIRGLS